MRVAVLIKQVPDSDSVRMDETTGTLIREGAGTVPNLLDLHAMSALAEWILDRPELHVTAVSMGPPTAARVLKEALSLGAHEAVLLTDRAFAGADTWATAVTLAGALRRLGPFDLVLCGEKATDGETGQVGPELATLLGIPFATRVRAASFGPDRVCVTRAVEEGDQRVELPLPCLLTVGEAVCPLALPTLAGKKIARRAEVRRLNAAELGLDPAEVGLAGSPTRVVGLDRPVLRRSCRLYPTARTAQGLEDFVRTLEDLGLLPDPEGPR